MHGETDVQLSELQSIVSMNKKINCKLVLKFFHKTLTSASVFNVFSNWNFKIFQIFNSFSKIMYEKTDK